MKKALFFIPAALLALASCTNDEPTYERTDTFDVFNLITPVDKSIPSYIEAASYTYVRDMYKSTVQVGSQFEFNGKEYSFTSGVLPCEDASVYGVGGFRYSSPDIDMISSDYQIVNLTGYATSWIQNPAELGISAIPSMPISSSYAAANIISYQVPGLCSVKTIQKEAFYVGNTVTSFNGQEATSSDVVFRFNINPKNNTANIAIYNAKFAPQMPKLTFVLKNLKFIPGNGTYTITGENIVPEGADGTPYPNFPFVSFELKPTNSTLTDITVDFQVTERFSGNFKGSFLLPIPV